MITIAEQVMPTSVEGAGSWWNQNPPASVATSAPLEPRPPVTSKIQPIGGARAQNRFSGRTAKPIFRSAPLDGAPKTVTGVDSQPAALPSQPKKSWRLPQRGKTCDGSITISDTINSNTATATAPTATATASRWKFNLDAWRWEVATDVAAGEKLAAQYHISARRWGDGRDALGAATTKTTTTTATKRSVAVVETLGSTKRRALLQVDISGRGGDSSLCEGFSSVGGFEKQKQVLIREIVYPLKHAALCKKVGIAPSRGVLLTGPPGSGKTFLARSLAAQTHLHLEYVAGAECVGGGPAEERLRRAFKAARNSAPSILFIDEIDAVAPARASAGASDAERQSTALTLSLIDALRQSNLAVAVVAATNRPDALDAALRRPGRLDVEIGMGPPSATDRESILRCAVRNMPVCDDVDLILLSSKLQGYMAADISGFATEAALRCVHEAVDAAEAAGMLDRLLHSSSPSSSKTEDSREEEEEEEEKKEIDPYSMAAVSVSLRHFSDALDSMAPAVLRELAAEVPRDVCWDDVGGLQSVKKELQEMVEWPLVHGDRLTAMGMRLPAGALLYGPPGCGKTLLAKAVAGCCGVNFISVRGPELLQKWLGESEKAVREVFSAARAAAPCVVFFDEVDAVAARRDAAAGGGGGSNSASAGDSAASRVLNQLLCELDGISSGSDMKHSQGGGGGAVFVLAATNRPAALDPALLRPGRLDRVLKVPLPDGESRGRIFARALRKVPMTADLDLNEFAAGQCMQGFSGADVSEVARRAGTAVLREDIEASSLPNECSTGVEIERVVCLQQRHLEAAVSGVRRSVSTKDERYFDEVEEKLAVGSLNASDAFGAAERSARREKALQMKLVAQAVEAACKNQSGRLQARVQQLEAALREAGVAVPPLLLLMPPNGDGGVANE